MKSFRIETEWISKKGLSGNMLLTYALIQASDQPMSNTDVANSLRITFPTAQKCLQRLADDGLIQASAAGYSRN